MKKFLVFAMTFLLALGNVAMAVGNENVKEDNDPEGYVAYYGTIESVGEEGKNGGILVKNELNEEEEGLDEIFLYAKHAPVMDLKTGEWIEDYEFTKGEKVQYFFREGTPMFQSLPPKLTPDVIAVNVDDGKYSLDVDHFDKDGNGVSGRLVIHVDEDAVAENLKGEEVKDFLDEDLAVLYTASTRSLPPQTNPEKIFVIEPQSKVVDLNDYKAEAGEGFYLRKYYEALGATVEWNQEEQKTRISYRDKSIELKNYENDLIIDGEVLKMEDFSVKDGTSVISEKYIEKINDFLLK